MGFSIGPNNQSCVLPLLSPESFICMRNQGTLEASPLLEEMQ